MTIGIVVRELTYLKVLQPIMEELANINVSYNLYHFDAPISQKEYNRATRERIQLSSKSIMPSAKKVKSFTNDNQLLNQLIHDKITKLVSLELWLSFRKLIPKIKKNKIKLYSLMYLTDSLWQKAEAITSMDRVYYTTKYIMEMQHSFAGVKFDQKRDRCIGSPIFDILSNKPSEGKDVLVLLPNLKVEHAASAFGNNKNFFKIIEKLSIGHNLIFKTRKKQWLPLEIKRFAKEIIYDGDKMYPSAMSEVLKQCYATVMFHSSGIYEAVYAGNYVINIKLPVSRWKWDKNKMRRYFGEGPNSLYQFDGVVESIDQKTILNNAWIFKPKHTDESQRKIWVKKFIGSEIQCAAKLIVIDLIKN